ncbi:TPA: transposase, partial [Escherichia coli]|uniref:transposase n=1 Tax=Escherichia coli TaxID=562 RepID=UPI00201AFB38
MIDVLGPEKRRRRTTQEKIAIVQQSFEPGMTVSLVARQHGVAASQGNDSNLLIVFYVQIMPDDFVMQL